MNDTGALRRFPASAIGPSLHFHLAGGDEGLEFEHVVGGFDETVAAALFQAGVLQEHLTFFVGLQLGDVCLSLCGKHEHFGVFVFHRLAHLFDIVVAGGGGGFIDVADVEDRLRGQQEKSLCSLDFFLGFKLHGAGAFALQKGFAIGEQDLIFNLCRLVAANLRNFLNAFDAVLNGFQVFQLQFRVNDFFVANGVHASIDVHDVSIVKTAEHVDDGVRLSDVAEKLVAESFALGGSFHQAGNIDDFNRGGNDSPWMNEFSKFVQTFVGHGDDADVRFNGAEGEIGRLCLCIAQTIEKSGLSDIRKSDDAAL